MIEPFWLLNSEKYRYNVWFAHITLQLTLKSFFEREKNEIKTTSEHPSERQTIAGQWMKGSPGVLRFPSVTHLSGLIPGNPSLIWGNMHPAGWGFSGHNIPLNSDTQWKQTSCQPLVSKGTPNNKEYSQEYWV